MIQGQALIFESMLQNLIPLEFSQFVSGGRVLEGNDPLVLPHLQTPRKLLQTKGSQNKQKRARINIGTFRGGVPR